MFFFPPKATVVADLNSVATVTSAVAVSPVTVVTVSTVPSPVTAVQTVPLLPAALPHSVAQPTAAMPAFPPVMVPPFRVPLPGMPIPLPGKNQTSCVSIEQYGFNLYMFGCKSSSQTAKGSPFWFCK